MTTSDQAGTESVPDDRVHAWVVRDPDELEAVYEIRHEVFVEEQHLTGWVRDDPDDRFSVHVLASVGGEIVGTGRVTFIGDEAQIAWVAVRKHARGLGVGRRVMDLLLDESRAQLSRFVSLNAQTHALSFYEQLGFRSIGRRFFMSNIEHQHMVLDLPEDDLD